MRIPKIPLDLLKKKLMVIILIAIVIILSIVFNLVQKITADQRQITTYQGNLASVSGELQALESQDQIKINKDLENQIKNIHDNFLKSDQLFEILLDLKAQNPKLDKKLDENYALAIKQLSDKNYSSASATLALLEKSLQDEQAKLAQPGSAVTPATPAVVSNNPPGSGFSSQSVQTGSGTFTVDIVAADLASTKVIVDTASDSDCSNNCPVLPLATYVARNGAYAGLNGAFFCPSTYPSCAGKTNSFDTLLMNYKKTYFNSSNNVYSTIPAVIFQGGSIRFVGQSLQWGRDTGIDSMIANYPMLVQGSNIAYVESPNEPKFGAKGARDFVANKGNTVYIGTIFGATMGDAAVVLKAMGMENALNMDEGGSTALWYGGYKAGPGRDLPNAILFVHR